MNGDLGMQLAHETTSSYPTTLSRAGGAGSGPLAPLADLKQLLQAARRRWRLIAGSLILGVVLAGLYLATVQPIYRATSRLMIVQQTNRLPNLAGPDNRDRPAGDGDDLPTHMALISSPLITGRAIESVGLANLPELVKATAGQEGGVLSKAIDSLRVTRPDRTASILNLAFDGTSRDEAIRLVGAIIQTYREFLLRDMHQKGNTQVIDLIQTTQGSVKRELEESEHKYAEFRQANPGLVVTGEGRPLGSRRLERWGHAANEAMIKSVRIRAQLKIAQSLEAEGMSLWAILHAIGDLGDGPSDLMKLVEPGAAHGEGSDHLRQLVREREQLTEQFGPTYSKVLDLQERIARLRGKISGPEVRGGQDEKADLIRAMERALVATESMQAECERRLTEDLAEVNTVEVALLSEQNLRDGMARQRAFYHTLMDQLKQAQFTNDYHNTNLQILEAPRGSAKPVSPRKSLALLLGMAGGCLLGCAAALVAELLDGRTRSLEELRVTLGLKVLGSVPVVKRTGLDPSTLGTIMQTQPHSQGAEAFRMIRTNFELARRSHHARIVAVTSPNADEGKSFVASNLAISLARAGRRVLLIDCNFQNPSLHGFHGLNQEPGLSQALDKVVPLNQVAQRSTLARIDVIASGTATTNRPELLGEGLQRVLEAGRAAYDVVILDLPPLLTASDSMILGANADGLVLVVRGVRIGRDDARRSLEALGWLDRPVLGVVLNAVATGPQPFAPDFGPASRRGTREISERGAPDESARSLTNGRPAQLPIS